MEELVMLQLEELSGSSMRLARIFGEARTTTVAVKTIARAARTSVECLWRCMFYSVCRRKHESNIMSAHQRSVPHGTLLSRIRDLHVAQRIDIDVVMLDFDNIRTRQEQ